MDSLLDQFMQADQCFWLQEHIDLLDYLMVDMDGHKVPLKEDIKHLILLELLSLRIMVE